MNLHQPIFFDVGTTVLNKIEKPWLYTQYTRLSNRRYRLLYTKYCQMWLLVSIKDLMINYPGGATLVISYGCCFTFIDVHGMTKYFKLA